MNNCSFLFIFFPLCAFASFCYILFFFCFPIAFFRWFSLLQWKPFRVASPCTLIKKISFFYSTSSQVSICVRVRIVRVLFASSTYISSDKSMDWIGFALNRRIISSKEFFLVLLLHSFRFGLGWAYNIRGKYVLHTETTIQRNIIIGVYNFATKFNSFFANIYWDLTN